MVRTADPTVLITLVREHNGSWQTSLGVPPIPRARTRGLLIDHWLPK
ncbi:hypothetical protein OAK47_01735 [Planctomycetaceae bacterium]|nr:hypothetical protein [Planctomycetaceae bacterium]